MAPKNQKNVFLWRKKIERDFSLGVVFCTKEEKKRIRERVADIEKVKKRREENAIKKAQRYEEMALLARERSRAEFQDWQKKEKEFEFEQNKLRYEIRWSKGRPKQIDILTKHLLLHDNSDHPNNNSDQTQRRKIIIEPCMFFKGLTVKELEELHNDIKVHLDLAPITHNTPYWEALLVVCESEIATKTSSSQLEEDDDDDVNKFLQGKTYDELRGLKSQIESNMRSGAAKLVDFWVDLLGRLDKYIAKAYLKEFHSKTVYETPLLEGEILVNKSSGLDHTELQQSRKPKYHHCVHTGYVWNKYNRIHYDHESPPPKIVQGYKFDIFYPDLHDESKAPTYTVEKDGESVDTCIVIFRAGPPYQDIAFRIFNKEWEYSRKKGFKCTFERGVFSLYFNFKRFSYRR